MGIVSESNNLGEGDNPECQFRRFQTLSRFTRWMEIEEGACRIRNVGWCTGLWQEQKMVRQTISCTIYGETMHLVDRGKCLSDT